jgi:hypothetical protein
MPLMEPVPAWCSSLSLSAQLQFARHTTSQQMACLSSNLHQITPFFTSPKGVPADLLIAVIIVILIARLMHRATGAGR